MKVYKYISAISVFTVAILLFSCKNNVAENEKIDGLKIRYSNQFLIGAAINQQQIFENDSVSGNMIYEQFNSLTAENDMKWENVQPGQGRFTFDATDKILELGEREGMFVVGHTLVWHSQTPGWVFEDLDGNLASRDTLLARMHKHISVLVGRCKGKVHGWDVVNEALNEDGTLRDSKWRQIIGDDYIEKAFEFVHEVDPEAELYYNDYNMFKPEKRAGAIQLIAALKEKGIRVDGIGMQAHYSLDYPDLNLIEESIVAYANAGLKVMFTELDVSVIPFPDEAHGADVSLDFELSKQLNPYPEGLPDTMQIALANRYSQLFNIFVKHREVVSRVTFWGVGDANSWRNNWPVKGRTDYPLLFDRNYNPKPAFDSVMKITL